MGLHKFLCAFETGAWAVFGAFDGRGECLGLAWGSIDGDGTFFVHCAFREDADVLGCAAMMEDAIRQDFPSLKMFEGDIPDKCWGAQILAKHLGFRDLGIIEGIKCLRGNPLEYCEVRKFVKEG